MRPIFSRPTVASAFLAVIAVLGTAAASAQRMTTVNLTAQRMSTTLPDGTVVPMWGYCSNDRSPPIGEGGEGPLGGGRLLKVNVCSTTVGTTSVPNTVWAPGPTIVVPAGNQLTIKLTNNIAPGTATSLVILGQVGGSAGAPVRDAAPLTHATQTTTTWNNNVTAPVPFVPPQQGARARSFAPEAAFGAVSTYAWNTNVTPRATTATYLKPGTYLYETGSHPSLQAPMGLYGVLIVTNAPDYRFEDPGTNEATQTLARPGQAFPGAYSSFAGTPSPLAALVNVPYDADATLLLSEIDAVQNTQVDAATVAGTSEQIRWNDPQCSQSQKAAPTVGGVAQGQVPCFPAAVNYAPTAILVNGKPYDQSNPAGTSVPVPDLAGSNSVSGNVLVRMLNAGLRTHVPAFVGLGLTLIAEDGNVAPGNPKLQNEVNMPPGKTIDAIVYPASNATGTTGATRYTDAVYPFLDRALGLSTNNQTKGGFEGYVVVAPATTATASGTTLTTRLNSAIGGSNAAAVTAQANPDSYTLSPNATSFSNNVLTNDISVTGAVIQGQTLAAGASSTQMSLTHGTVTLGTNGALTFTTTTPPTSFPSTDSFTYCGNGGTTCALVSLTFEATGNAPTALARTYDNSAMSAYSSNVASLIMVPQGAGLLVGARDPSNYPLTAQFSGTAPAWVTLNPDGSFTATPCTAVAGAAATCSFQFVAVNSQGTASAPATATVVFPVGSGLSLNLVDAQSGTPLPGNDYGWIIEEDQTWHNATPGITPPITAGTPTPSLATSFHRSHSPIVAAGCTGPLSCRDAQTRGGVVTQPQPRSLPGDVALDPTKWYYISILPGDASNPFVAGFGGDPLLTPDCLTPTAGNNDAKCGHTMGGAAIAPRTGTGYPVTTVRVEPNPLKPAQLSIYIFEDSSPTNGDPDANEHGLGGFEIVVWDVAGRSGDPIGQVTYDAYNMPLTNALLGTPGCPNVASRTPSGAGPTSPNYASRDLSGTIFTCPNDPVDPSNPSPEYSLQGQALIKNLMPGRYDVIAHPGAAREGAGERWFQVSTLEGTPGQDAFTKSGEPAFFQEFGPPGFHTFIGFMNPAHIAQQNLIATHVPVSGVPAPPTGDVDTPTATGPIALQTTNISGRVTSLHMSRPVMETLWDSGTNASLQQTTCFAGLNQAGETGLNIGFTACDPQGNFTLTNIPVGSYTLVIWDQWLDQIIAFKQVQVAAGATPDANGNPVPAGPIAMGDIPVFSWFTRVETSTYVDVNGNGTRDPGEPGIAQVPFFVRFRDGSISNKLLTDSNGNAVFDELFPLFNWYVLESDRTRFASTGVNVTVDGGGLPDCVTYNAATGQGALTTAGNASSGQPCARSGGVLNSSYVWTDPVSGQPFGAVPTGTSSNTNRIDPTTTMYEGLQGFINQTELLDWGKRVFNSGENGGVQGTVVYASTRGFDDPSLEVQFMWEPGVPRVQINLYREISNADGTTGLLLVNTTRSTSWDDFATGVTATGAPNLVCPGQDPNDPFLKYTLGVQNQFKCYDGFHLWNQVQPAQYDGAYSITNGYPYGIDATTGAPLPVPAGAPAGATNAPTGLPAGKYVVEMVLPPGYEIVKEEDKNILIGDAWVAPVAQQFANVVNIFIMPDQAQVGSYYNPNNANNATTTLGFQGAKVTFPACVGSKRTVPDFLSLFPNSGQVAPFAGAQKALCDRKEIILNDQQTAGADFFVFSDTPRASHFTGLILDDAATEINAASPDFGEKFAVSYAPVSLRDPNGVEVSRVYSDQWGTYNGVIYSTWQVNVPNPAGYSPNMLVTCMNDPGPITDTRVGSPTFGQKITDPLFNPSFSNFCYTNPFMPGLTVYLDTPVLPVAAFADGYNPPDCAYPDSTPAISRVDGDNIGPWVAAADGTHTLTITALGDLQVPNPAYQGPSASTTPFNQRNVTRHYGFGSTQGSVRVNGKPLTNVTWSDGLITGTVAAGTTSGELVIRTAKGLTTVDSVTVTISPPRAAGTLGASDPGSPVFVKSVASNPAPGTTNGLGIAHPIQNAIDAARPGDLIIVDAGHYPEMLIMWKPVLLQGVGAASVVIDASKYPTQKLEDWRPRINNLFGIDVTTGNTLANPQVDSVPTQQPITGGTVLLEPTILATEEGAGVTVLAKDLPAADCQNPGSPRNGPSSYYAITATNNGVASQVAVTPTGYNMGDSNFRCARSRIDGLSITGSDAGGGIFVNGWAHGIEISNNRIFSNASAMHGGLRIGSPFEEETVPPNRGYGYNDHAKIHHNAITKNGTIEATPGAGGGANVTSSGSGISLCTGTDNYAIDFNFICGNYSSGDGGGIGVLGVNKNGVIAHNKILFNQSYQQTATVHGGGITIEGDRTANPALSNGTGNVTINANLIVGNYAQAGHGGGIRLQQVNGNDVVANPNDPSKWYVAKITNNIITNNMAGWSGGGISLVDTLRAVIADNTIANNDSAASVGSLFGTGGRGPTTAYPSPAGISTDMTTTALLAVLPANASATVPVSATKAWNAFSNPVLLNDVIWHNRSFFVDASSGAALVCSSNQVADAGASCKTLPAQTAAGECTGSPAYWDVGAVGDASAATSAFTFGDINYSVVTPGGSIYSAATGTGVSTSDPGLTQPYCNGARANPAYKFEPGQPFLPPFNLAAGVTLDEAGNFVDLKFGPLSLSDPLQPGFVPYGDYSVTAAGAAYNSGALVDPTSNVTATPRDFRNAPRPSAGRTPGVDIGATQVPGRHTVTIDPHQLVFDSAVATTASQIVTVTNTGGGSVAFGATPILIDAGGTAFTQTNDCGTMLVTGESCQIQVTFTPSTGAASSALHVTFAAGQGIADATIPLIVGAQAYSVAPATLAFTNQAVAVRSAPQTITVTNNATTRLPLASIALSGVDAAEFALSPANNCGASLAGGASCTINVLFAPTSGGAKTAAVAITPSGGAAAQSVALTGSAVTPSYGFTPSPLAFGNQLIGTTSGTQTVTLTNTGTVALPITSVSIFESNATDFNLAGTTCAGALAPSGSCTATVSFTPVSAGAKSATLSVIFGAGITNGGVALSGTGVVPQFALAPASIAFQAQFVTTTSAPQAVTLTNTGAVPVPLPTGGITLNGVDAAQFALAPAGNCGASVAVGASCTINVTFSPSSSGAKAASLTVAPGSGAQPASVSLAGTGLAPTYTLAPNLAFGDQPLAVQSPPRAVTLTNTGAVAVPIQSIAVAGTNSDQFAQTNSCGTSVAVAASCSINVTFTPTSAGVKNATIVVTSGLGAASQSVAVSGTGRVANYSLAPNPVAFGGHGIGTSSAAQTVTVTNTGLVPMVISNVALAGANPGQYSLINNCPNGGTSLAAGSTCTINVTFAPTATGSQPAEVTVTVPTAVPATRTVRLTGTGAPPVAALSPLAPNPIHSATNCGAAGRPACGTGTLQLSNGGAGVLNIAGIDIGGGANAGRFTQTNNCGSSLAPGASCVITVTYRAPGGAGPGVVNATLTVRDNSQGNPSATQLRTLRGTSP